MAYGDKVTTLVVAIFLVVAIVAQWTDAQPMPEVDPICATSIPEIVKHCYPYANEIKNSNATVTVTPSEECCKDLRTASKKEVNCLCDNFLVRPDPLLANITSSYFIGVNIMCNVRDKYKCNGGSTNKIAASMGLLGLVASLFF